MRLRLSQETAGRSTDDSLEFLLDSYFPRNYRNEILTDSFASSIPSATARDTEFVTESKIARALNIYKRFESPGRDDLTERTTSDGGYISMVPGALHRNDLTYIHTMWRATKMAFIFKAENPSCTGPKYVIPIILPSFFSEDTGEIHSQFS